MRCPKCSSRMRAVHEPHGGSSLVEHSGGTVINGDLCIICGTWVEPEFIPAMPMPNEVLCKSAVTQKKNRYNRDKSNKEQITERLAEIKRRRRGGEYMKDIAASFDIPYCKFTALVREITGGLYAKT